MNKSEKGELLKRMKEALEVGQKTRKRYMATLDQKLHEQVEFAEIYGKASTALLRKSLAEARSRRMLAEHTTVDKDGKETKRELFHVKPKEPYHKRPSVRAMKKSRSKGGGLGM